MKDRSDERDPSRAKCLTVGFLSLAFYMPLGLTLEALHALKVPVYLGSSLRREMWTLAHAHGNVLGLLLLVFAAVGAHAVPDAAARGAVARSLRVGAVLMPLGFLAAGVLNFEGDPSLGIVLVPIGAVFLLVGLVRAGVAQRS